MERNYQKMIVEIKERIVQEIDPQKVFLFGSYAWGTPKDSSDLDFFIVDDSGQPRRKRQAFLRKKLFDFGVPMDFIIYSQAQFDASLEKKDLFINKIVKQGRVLYEKE